MYELRPQAFWQLSLFLIAILTAITTTLFFGIKFGRLTAPLSHNENCQLTGRTRPMWDFEHVPNPRPVYHQRVFAEISDARSFKSAEDAVKDTTWQNILTPEGGFLLVKQPDGEVVGYGVSMFHQLHCLTMMRDMLLGQPMSHAHETEDWSEDNMHWLHCLDYLAQGILCAADDTLEKPGFTKNFKGKMVKGIDGMGHTHQCKNSTQLREAVLQSESEPRSSDLLGPTTVFKIPGLDSKGEKWVVSES